MEILPGKFLMICCHYPDDKYSLYIPHTGESAWVMRVSEVLLLPANEYIVLGPLLFNDTHDITGPFEVSEHPYTMLISSEHILGVYDATNF